VAKKDAGEFETKILLPDKNNRRERMLAMVKCAQPPLSPEALRVAKSLAKNFDCLENPQKFSEQLPKSLQELHLEKCSPYLKIKIGREIHRIASFVFTMPDECACVMESIKNTVLIMSIPNE